MRSNEISFLLLVKFTEKHSYVSCDVNMILNCTSLDFGFDFPNIFLHEILNVWTRYTLAKLETKPYSIHLVNIFSCVGATIRRGFDWILHLLTTYRSC
jgi:hypothetical protein